MEGYAWSYITDKIQKNFEIQNISLLTTTILQVLKDQFETLN